MDIDPSAAFEHDRDLPQAITDEELFEAYLSARLGQALETPRPASLGRQVANCR